MTQPPEHQPGAHFNGQPSGYPQPQHFPGYPGYPQQPPKKSINGWMVAVIVMLAIPLLCCGGFFGLGIIGAASSAQSSSSSAAAEDVATEPDGEVIKVDAGDILDEFSENELAADTKYEGKTVEVSGEIGKIDTDVFDKDEYILNISDGGQFSITSVYCRGMPTEVLKSLTVGDPITVRAKFDDGGDLGIELRSCKVV